MKARDIVDVAAVMEREPEGLLLAARRVLPSRIWVLEWRWDRIRERFAAEAEPLWILEEGLRERAPGLFEEFLRGLGV